MDKSDTVFGFQSEQKLAEQIERQMARNWENDPQLQSALEASRRYAQERFSWETIMQEIVRL